MCDVQLFPVVKYGQTPTTLLDLAFSPLSASVSVSLSPTTQYDNFDFVPRESRKTHQNPQEWIRNPFDTHSLVDNQ